ncbi:MAG: leucyl aminopeptidase [Proteobacteria bacterium]|jgi:leucyl aminopeptidase|nr:leucyl aminopeptidase [Pseudomonadota bacterium]MDA1301542.1 leucyl aminopeptidase [Pseudomonadota bacterium]
MDYASKLGQPEKSRAQCVVIPIFEEGGFSTSGRQLNLASGGYLTKIIKRGDIKGGPGETLLLHDVPGVNTPRILLVGLGKADTVDVTRLSLAAGATINQLKTTHARSVLCCLAEVTCQDRSAAWKVSRLIEIFEQNLYSYQAMKSNPPAATGPEKLDFLAQDRDEAGQVQEGITRGSALTVGIRLGRDVANTPPNICHPTYLAEQATALASQYSNLAVDILDEEHLAALSMGAFLSVSQGSDQPGKLIILQYQGTEKTERPHIIVGKGITFDTGGISLKPRAGMEEMTYDMCGAASVLGTIAAVARQGLRLNVVAAIAAAENMPSGGASRPGDIVTTMSGQTVEILNTDAEGRLVLCDTLTYIDRFNPASVIDVATLTGACVTALGSVATGLFANDDALADAITRAGTQAHDRVWRLPIWEEYQPQLASPFADMSNVGGKEAGAITAACFLARYTRKYRWAHLDIAGTGYTGSGPGKGYSGRPIPLLTQYLNDQVA